LRLCACGCSLQTPKLGGKLPGCISLVVGTRPEAIKLAPVAAALSARGLRPTIILTGQHPQLEPAAFGLSSYSAVRLHCPGQANPHAHAGAVSRAVAALLSSHPSELVVIQGDTSSALGGALGARLAGIPVAHVEAGLRSHDIRNPWPEEEFRIAIDSECELLFAPTELSAANLRRERIRGAVHITGNSGIDAVLNMGASFASRHSPGPPRLLVTCHRRENWGQGLAAIASALRQIAEEEIARVEVILHPNPLVSGQMRAMLLGHPGIACRNACSHSEAVAAMLGSDLVLSDSGGIQEEASVLGVPLLVLRIATERPEAIASGNVELIGTDPKRIVSAVRGRLARNEATCASLPFGDGHAGERIAVIIADWLAARSEPELRLEAVGQTAYSW